MCHSASGPKDEGWPCADEEVYDGTFKDITVESGVVKQSLKLTTPPKPNGPPARLSISKVAKSFASAMSASRLIDFLIWFLYYDVVELLNPPDEWYEPFKNIEMRGCTELVAFLAQSQNPSMLTADAT